MKTLKKVAIVLPILAFLIAPLAAPSIADAQSPDIENPASEAVDSPIENIDDVETVLQNVIGWAQTFLFALSALFIIIAGFKYMTAGGNEDEIKTAKNMLIYALVGIVLGLIAGGVVNFINDFLQT